MCIIYFSLIAELQTDNCFIGWELLLRHHLVTTVDYSNKYGIVPFAAVPTPILNVTRDPDIGVTLRHGDPLTLNCTIQLDRAVDGEVVVNGTLKGEEQTASDLREVSSGVYQTTLAISSLSATPLDVYTCTATISPSSNITSATPTKTATYTLNITVGKIINEGCILTNFSC